MSTPERVTRSEHRDPPTLAVVLVIKRAADASDTAEAVAPQRRSAMRLAAEAGCNCHVGTAAPTT
jgi:hypothetical protein